MSLRAGPRARRRAAFDGVGLSLHGLSTDDRPRHALTLTLPCAGFMVVAGEPGIGGLHGARHSYHCGRCMSWVFTRPSGMDFINVCATMLDDARWFAPYVEV